LVESLAMLVVARPMPLAPDFLLPKSSDLQLHLELPLKTFSNPS
jgi:hypothetical protein